MKRAGSSRAAARRGAFSASRRAAYGATRHVAPVLVRVLLLIYPRRFRTRFGDSLMRDFLDTARDGDLWPSALDLFLGGVAERRRERQRAASVRHHTALTRRPAPRLDRLMLDIRHILRRLFTRPAHALIVIATLAVGIGANTAVFSLVNGVLLTEMPYRDPSRLAFLWTKLAWIGVPRAWVAAPHIPLLASQAGAIESIAAIRTTDTQLTGSGEPRMLRMGLTTTNLLDVLGVRPMLGRGFVAEDAPAYVAILTHDLWTSQFGADPAIVGRTIELSAERFEVIGVMPESFTFVVHSSLDEPSDVDVWVPSDWPLETMSDGSFGFAALVRVRPDATLAQAQAEIDVIGARLDRERYGERGFGWQLTPLQEDLVGAVRPGLMMLAAAALGILLIVCANVAGLGLVERVRRARELTIRAALGAGRARIVGSLVMESVVLALAGGAGGALLAWLSIRAIAASPLLALPRMHDVTMDWRVLLFALVLSIAVGVASGLWPAWRAARTNLTATLRDGGRGATAHGGRARGALIAMEIALAVMLVAAAGVLYRSFSTLQGIDAGFNPHHVLTADVSLPYARYQQESQAWQFHRQLAERLAALPGVSAVGGADAAPLSGRADQAGVAPEGFDSGGYVGADGRNVMTVDLVRTTPGYLQAMGIVLQRGRDFTWDDRSDAPRVAIVDDVLARQVWPGGESPIGRTLPIGDTKAEIVGVIRQPRLYQMGADDRPQVFVPWLQDTTLGLTLSVRTTGDPAVLAEPLRQAVWAIDANLPVAEVMPMRARVDLSMGERRLQLSLLAGFAVAALLLASIGLYGMISSAVTQRTQEMGVRAALGASVASIRALVLRQALVIAGIGVALGVVGALALGGLLSRFAYGVTGRDPLTLVATILVLLAVAVVAAFVPARRAARVDPIVALREG